MRRPRHGPKERPSPSSPEEVLLLAAAERAKRDPAPVSVPADPVRRAALAVLRTPDEGPERVAALEGLERVARREGLL